MSAAVLVAVAPGAARAQYAPPPSKPPRLCAGDAFVDVVGTRADDRLAAFPRATRVWGLGGDDTLTGSPTRAACLLGGTGDDALELAAGGGIAFGGAGRDAVIGSDLGDIVRPGKDGDGVDARGGDDKVAVRDGNPELVSCGDGADIVKADRVDILIGCESVNLAGPSAQHLSPRPRAVGRHGAVRVRLTARRAGDYRALYVTTADGRRCGGGPVEVSDVSASRGEHVRMRLRAPRRGWCPGSGKAVVVRYPDGDIPPVGVARLTFSVR